MQQAGKLFGSKFRAYALRDRRKCPKCNEDFLTKYDKFAVNHRPILLKCGHNLCEQCVQDSYQKLVCPICSYLTPLRTGNKGFRVRDHFDLNFYMFGELCNYSSFRENPNTSLLNCTQAKSISVDGDLEYETCRECDNSYAAGSCRDCNNATYCMKCYYKVHNHSKVLQSHHLDMFSGDRSAQGLQPKPTYCQAHRAICEHYCKECKCVCCNLCAKKMHKTHIQQVQRLAQYNEHAKIDILATIEMIKSTRDNLRKYQQEVAHTQAQLRMHAAETLNQVSEYFLQMHCFLQNKQQEIFSYYKKNSEPLQHALQDASSKLDKSYSTLNTMLQNLNYFAEKPPINIHVNDLLSIYTRKIEGMSVEMKISKVENNPFIFHIKYNPQMGIRDSFNYNFQDPRLKISTIAQQCNNSLYNSISLERSNPSVQYSLTPAGPNTNIQKSPKPKKRNKNWKSNKNLSPTATNNSKHNANAVNKYYAVESNSSKNNKLEVMQLQPQQKAKKIFAKVTHLQDPNNFYIQLEDNLDQLCSLSKKYAVHFGAYESQIPRNIDIGSVYMVYYDHDKQWHRCLANRAVSKDVYEAFLVDIGETLEIERKSFRTLDAEDANIPFAAVLCTLYELMPAGKNWSTEAIHFFLSLTKNNRLCIQLVNYIDQYWKIDILTVVNGDSISVRDSFLYTGLGRCLDSDIKRPLAAFKTRIPKQVLHSMEILNVNMRHVESPQEFYVIKNEHMKIKKKLFEDLNQEYDSIKSELTPIPCGLVLLACAVEKFNKWHRGRIEEILDEGQILVHLVDEGTSDIFPWHQIYALKSTFMKQAELTIQCRLADIEPLREKGYEWTDEAISEFKMLSSNPVLVMTVHGEMQQQYLVALHVMKKEWNANIGALLVKSGLGVSSGKHTSSSEIVKINNNLDNYETTIKCLKDKDINFHNANITMKSDESVRTLKRSNVKVMHIKHPGHFYLQLADVAQGVNKFLTHLQNTMEEMEEILISDYAWYVGDHCLVIADLTKPNSGVEENLKNCSIYRAVIYDIDYDIKPSSPYKVFLRDYGIILEYIKDSQLRTIPTEFDRVANSVFRCHLACVKPTAGNTEWSQSSIDFLKNIVEKIPNISATLHGERVPNTKSTSIILWGTTNEISDPLAPTLTKHICINRQMVNAGLAHLTDRFDFRQQVDDLIAKEVNDNEITIEQWFNDFPEKVNLKAIDHLNEVEDEDDFVYSDYNLDMKKANQQETTNDIERTPVTWLEYKNIEKSVFVGKPTYLDNNCIIHLHDSEDERLLAEICAHINSVYMHKFQKKIADVEPQRIYGSGQGCIAKFHLDNKYYRALIHGYDKSTNSYIVRFIDYGNMENVDLNNVHLFTPFPEIPALASRYCLEGICPPNKSAKYETIMLDTLHQMIVNKLVQVRLVGNQFTETIKRCTMRIGSMDLLEFLCDKGFVDRTLSNVNIATKKAKTQQIKSCQLEKNDDCITQLLERIEQQETQETIERSKNHNNKKRIFDQADYKRMHNELKLYGRKSQTEWSGFSDRHNDFNDEEDNCEENELNVAGIGQSFSDFFCPNDENDDDEDDDNDNHIIESLESSQFCPNDTSTITQYSGTECFKRPQLPFGVKGFNCEIVRILSPTIIQMKPLLREFQFQDTVLQQRIQHIAVNAPRLKHFAPRTVCLARYSEDNLYYRGTIRSYNAAAGSADVLYVDYMHTETACVKDLLECPEVLATLPLRTFRVRLFGISPKPGQRDRAVCQELAKCFDKITLYARVKKRPCDSDCAAGDLIQVALYESRENPKYIYQSLIDNGIYEHT